MSKWVFYDAQGQIVSSANDNTPRPSLTALQVNPADNISPATHYVVGGSLVEYTAGEKAAYAARPGVEYRWDVPTKQWIYEGSTITSITPNFSLTNSTPNQRIEFLGTNAGSWANGAGQCVCDFEFVSNGFFTHNPNAHMAVALRIDTSVLGQHVRGHGMVIGNVIGAQEAPPYAPTTMAETWFGGLGAPPGQRFLIPGSEGYIDKPLQDGVTYRMVFSSVVMLNGDRMIRYQLYRWNDAVGAWDIERDTGHVLDLNVWADFTFTGFAFGYVFHNPSAPAWSFDVSDLSITWGPAPEVPATYVPTWVRDASRVAQNLDFVSQTNPRLRGDCSSSDVTKRFAVQSIVANGSTIFWSMPNGSSTISRFAALNTSNPAGQIAYAYVGMNGSQGEIGTVSGNGHADAPLWVSINGQGVVRFTKTAVHMVGDTQRILIKSNDADFQKNFAFEDESSNTLVLAKPAASGSRAQWVAINRNNFSGPWQYAFLSIDGAAATLGTFQGAGAGVAPLLVNIGGTEIAEMTASGIRLAGASNSLTWGQGSLDGPYNVGGAAASSGADVPFNYEQVCAAGGISGILGVVNPAVSLEVRDAIETAVRLLYCHVSKIIDAQRRHGQL